MAHLFDTASGPTDARNHPETDNDSGPAPCGDKALRKIVEQELSAHARRYDWLGRDLARNVSWTILLGAMASRLRGVDLTAGEVAAFEAAPQSLVLRWAEILAAQGLIFIRENAPGKSNFTLRGRGHALVTGYLTGKMIHEA